MRVLIIGGSSSIGRKVVEAFAEHGSAVMATFASRPLRARAGVRTEKLDLLQPESFQAFVETRVKPFGKLDATIALAGVLPGKNLENYSVALMEQVMRVNFTAQAHLIKLILPRMAKGSHVLLMSSISSQEGSFDPIYAASKAALNGFMKSLAVWHGKNVRFNCLAPGLIEKSTMYWDMKPERRAHHKKLSPTGKLLKIEDVSQVIYDLCQPQWSHLNGQVIGLSGGRSV